MDFTVERDGFHGVLYRPGADAYPGKALVAFGGSDGKFSLTQMGAEVFRAKGMTVLALAYWNAPGLPGEFNAVPVEPVERAARWLHANGYDRVGLWGVSMGGELALLAGSLLPELVSCVVAVSPLSHVTQGFSWKPSLHTLSTSAFGWRGRALPYAPLGEIRFGRMVGGWLRHRELYMRDLYENAFAGDVPPEAEIAVEQIGGPVLLLSAEQDAMCPTKWCCERVARRLAQRGFPHSCTHLNYEYASHYLLPFTLKARSMFAIERRRPKECAASRADALQKTLDFLSAW